MRLEGKNILITGASSGMGNAMAKLFASEGANVLAVARRKERLEELKEGCKDAPGKIEIFSGDVSKKEDVDAMIDEIVKVFGSLDVLVNNAGVMDNMAGVSEFEEATYEKVMGINVYGPLLTMRKAIQVFKEQGNGGNIINLASIGAMRAAAGVVYSASKAAVVAMTKNTAYMYQPDNIRVNAIAPGGIATEIGTSMGQPNMAGYGRLERTIGLAPEPGQPEDIAKAALFLASDDSSYISGDVLVVDGGWITN